MQTRIISQDFLTGKDVTTEILTDIATRHCKMESEHVAKLAKQGKLIGAIRKYLQDPNNGYAESFKDGTLELDIAALPDPVVEKQNKPADAKKQRRQVELKGNYVVVKRGVKATAETDPGKHSIWEKVFACTSFEQYFKEAPAKAVTATGRVITAKSELLWALQSGWIVPASGNTQAPAPQPPKDAAPQQQSA